MTLRIHHMSEAALYHGHSDKVFSVAWSPNGKALASASFDGTVWIRTNHAGMVPLNGMKVLPENHLIYRGHSGPVYAVAWSPDGHVLASGGQDGTIHIWSPLDGELQRISRTHTGAIKALCWSPNGR